jgi:hypothetical protein
VKIALLAIALAAMGCKSESARKADHAAHRVQAERKHLEQAINRSTDLAKPSGKLVKAQSEFATHRRARVMTLRAAHAVISSQPMLISMMARNFALSDAGRADVDQKLVILQMHLDEAKNLIEALDATDASIWEERDDAVRTEMDKLETARRDAWKALENAPRTAS